MQFQAQSGRAFLAVAVLAAMSVGSARAEVPAVESLSGGRLKYNADERGNRIPDFSNCGYAGADRDIPDVPTVVTVSPADGDDTTQIQAAIDQVSKLSVQSDGFRGAVALASGTFHVAGQLRITHSGVVLRGAGAGDGGTTIVATGTDRRTLIRVIGNADRGFAQKPSIVVDDYVPVGARGLRLSSVGGYRVGTRVEVTRPSTREWIETIGADAFGVGWRPGSRDLHWDRIITAIDGDVVTLDAPITTAIDKRFGVATIVPTKRTGSIENVGVEDMCLVSQPSTDRPLDEDHAWHGITIENAQNAWVRRVEFAGFAGGAVALWESTKWVTVEDCISLAPVSEVGGFRRHAFFTQGQLTLFLHCWSEHGRHDFAVGHCAPGPNAFVNCRTRESLADSGPLESWASGVLYDNVRIDGNALNLINRWTDPPGTGWSAANCVLWQCRAAKIACFRPPTANNWAIGCWAAFSGDGTFESQSDFVRPLSLYQAQLRERLGDAAAKRVGTILGEPVTATNPTLEEAAEFAATSHEPARELIDGIRARIAEHMKPGGVSGLGTGGQASIQPPAPSPQPLSICNGWLVAGDKLITGGSWRQNIWRGNMRADDVAQFGPAITRFAPGRVGPGFTEDLDELTTRMVDSNIAAFDYSYSLWYDRRRDDHTMGRQEDGNVAPPFLEQPFARTGPEHGKAWDGLSKYDLTKPNRWYWDRLRTFADECGEKGRVLLHQHYLQHNILEAGAHWSDSPWRPANNINDTGLPEPPPYIGDKRQFMAATFYDVENNPKLRELHRGYICQCLDSLADSPNVIQMTSAEYSGPLAFTQFWLDTIIEWEQEHGRDVVVALSAPKDVQDAILADPERAKHVDAVDIRYWAYTGDGKLYAPDGGQNLAPRQHLRQTRLKPGGPAAIVKAVREYRDRYPEKAILYNAEENCPANHDGWAVLVAGGSLADVRLPSDLAAIIPTMKPAGDASDTLPPWRLENERGDVLIYAPDGRTAIDFDSTAAAGNYQAKWIDRNSGEVIATESLQIDKPTKLHPKTEVLWLQRE